jgi:hypothetical protein
MTFLLHHGTVTRRVVFLWATVNLFRGPQFPWVPIFLKMFLLHSATAARRDTFLQATANFLWDPQTTRVSSFGSPRRPAARCRPLCRFFIVLEDFTAASSIRTFWHFMPGKSPPYPFDRRLSGPQSRSGGCGKEKNLDPARIRTLAVQFVCRHGTAWSMP